MTRRKFGKVITPRKVVSARVPKSLRVTYEIAKMMERGFSLDRELQFLLHAHISEVNQCQFCIDIAQAVLFFAGGRSDYITGQVLSVSGGFSTAEFTPPVSAPGGGHGQRRPFFFAFFSA